jgi:hypothetical protein
LARVQEFVNRFTGSISPLLSLYTQAWEARYTKRRLETLFDEQLGTGGGEVQTLLQSVRTYGSILEGFTSTLPTPPPVPEVSP